MDWLLTVRIDEPKVKDVTASNMNTTILSTTTKQDWATLVNLGVTNDTELSIQLIIKLDIICLKEGHTNTTPKTKYVKTNKMDSSTYLLNHAKIIHIHHLEAWLYVSALIKV